MNVGASHHRMPISGSRSTGPPPFRRAPPCESERNFHLRMKRLPPALIEYVAAHMLVHLLEPRHDAAFWGRLERVLPDYRQRKQLQADQGGRC